MTTATAPLCTAHPYDLTAAADWDAVVAASVNGTLQHTRAYLSHHGDRFEDRSVLLRDARDRPVGVIAAAVDPHDASRVVSHPGLTYGGVVHDGSLTGELMAAALRAAGASWVAAGHRTLRYKAIPRIYHSAPADDDRYALFALGARLERVDLACAVDLATPRDRSSQRRRGLKRARREGVEIATGAHQAAPFWPVLEATLADRHGVAPVHSLAEIQQLADRLPGAIDIAIGRLGGEVVAGTVLYRTATADHAQYIAASDAGTAVNALDAVFDHCLERAAAEGRRWFSFGISTVAEGRELNQGLHAFKAGFGGGGVVHEFFALDLPPALGG